MKRISMPFGEYEEALVEAGVKGENHAVAQFIMAIKAVKSGDRDLAFAILNETFTIKDANSIVDLLGPMVVREFTSEPTPGSRL